MATTTTFYGLYLPSIGDGSGNGQQWGPQVNNNFTVIDTTMNGLVTKVDPRSTGVYQHGTAPDYFEIEADGTAVLHGEATSWNDINISLVPPAGGAAAPAVIPFNGDSRLDCYAFSGTNPTPDEVHSSLEILHDYLEGSDIQFHIHWYPTTAAVGNVKWKLRYTWFNRGTVPGPATTVSAVAATSGVAWSEKTTAFTISGAGMTMGSRLVFTIFRDATDPQDTYAANAAVTDTGIHYERDGFGSRQMLVK